MNAKQFLIIFASVLMSSLSGPIVADEARRPFVRLAELDIDPAQLDSFKSAIKEGIEAAVRVEPGVLALYAVSEKTIHPALSFLKSIRMRMHTRRIWKRPILRNSGPLRTRWSSPANLSTLSPLCSVRRTPPRPNQGDSGAVAT